MSFEVEIKYRAPDQEALRARLIALGAREGSEIEQEDVYFAHPGRDFASTDEAFRLRRLGDENRITYKGPKQAGPTKTREEIEVRFEGGADARIDLTRLLDRLGFRPVATIPKVRSTFEIELGGRRMEVALDLAPGLGSFAEVEAIAEGPDDLSAAQAAVLELAGTLGLTEVEPRSYLRLTLERAFGNSAGPT